MEEKNEIYGTENNETTKKDKITTDEIVEAINLLERGKSVGKTDGITTKMVKNTNEKG